MKTKHFFVASILLSAFLLIIGNSCKKSDDSNNNTPTTKNISIVGMTYSPASLTVAKGTIVKWTNNDTNPHTATSNDGTTFDSGNMNTGDTYSYTANTAGTFPYYCTIHGVMMSGTLIVNP
ncbi:MAG: cupredoxin domain-containing protein [Ferruginibacter sp.]